MELAGRGVVESRLRGGVGAVPFCLLARTVEFLLLNITFCVLPSFYSLFLLVSGWSVGSIYFLTFFCFDLLLRTGIDIFLLELWCGWLDVA